MFGVKQGMLYFTEIAMLESFFLFSICILAVWRRYAILSSPRTGKETPASQGKTAKKPLFVHYQSTIPEKSKINFIGNERKRIEDKWFTKTTTTKHQNMFDDILGIVKAI